VRGCFVTGTDSGVGKTVVVAELSRLVAITAEAIDEAASVRLSAPPSGSAAG
jgi:dethiobiotin synthetase